MQKIKVWLKQYWQLIVLAVSNIGWILVWLISGGRRRLSTPLEQPTEEIFKAKDRAIEELRARDAEIAKLAEEKLQNASVEQIREFQKMQDKTLEEVAKWINSIH